METTRLLLVRLDARARGAGPCASCTRAAAIPPALRGAPAIAIEDCDATPGLPTLVALVEERRGRARVAEARLALGERETILRIDNLGRRRADG
jgi:hypothetical protein